LPDPPGLPERDRGSADELDSAFPPLPTPRFAKQPRPTSGSSESTLGVGSGHQNSADSSPSTIPHRDAIAQVTQVDASSPRTPLPRLGDYDLIRPLGRGGMGTVYLARHRVLGREAAIKVLTLGTLADASQRLRLAAEARIAAKLQHPHIVRLFEFGESDQGPFLVFEYVCGTTLDERIQGTPQAAGYAAELVRTLACAVEYAHRQGVIHRDLKPANILVDTEHVPKIADFGLARAFGQESGATRTGEILGTPAYMSPEQAGGATTLVGPATDIYSLGAILFELLTGTPPFRGTDAMAIVLAVLSSDPPLPRQLDRSIPRDLETICLKCLEKQPARRYGSADELASDLQRFLQGRPILARRASTFEKGWKLARRHPAAAVLVFVVVFGLTTFLTYAIWKNQQLVHLLARSDSNFRSALEATQRRIATAGQPADQVLEEELKFLTAIRQRTSDQVTTRYENAIAASLIGQILFKLGRHEEALHTLEEAATILAALVQDDSGWSSWYRGELAGVYATRAQIEQARGELEQAEASMHRGLDVIRELSQADPENLPLVRDQAAIWNNLAILANRRNRTEDAVRYHRHAIQLKEDLLKRDPGNARYLSDLTISLNNLASVLTARQELSDAVEQLNRAAQLIKELPGSARQESTNRYTEAGIAINLAEIHQRQGDRVRSLEQFQIGVAILEKLARDYPEIIAWQVACAEAETRFGLTLMTSEAIPADPLAPLTDAARRVLTEAIQQFESAVSRYEKLAESHPDDSTYRQSARQLQPGIAQLKAAIEGPP